MADRDPAVREPVDYHTRPALTARVDPGIKAWAYEEAARCGQGIGEFLDEVLAAERDRRAAALAPGRLPS